MNDKVTIMIDKRRIIVALLCVALGLGFILFLTGGAFVAGWWGGREYLRHELQQAVREEFPKAIERQRQQNDAKQKELDQAIREETERLRQQNDAKQRELDRINEAASKRNQKP